ncbi:MAG: hypothetical protein WCD18_14695 [Thermosynechococcaceae cyanobacterium]
MQITDTIPSIELDPVKDRWNFLEVWVDPMQSPPYVLLLLGDQSGDCYILDPAEGYRIIKKCESYEDAQFWLSEDEYEPLEGRLSGLEIHGDN